MTVAPHANSRQTFSSRTYQKTVLRRQVTAVGAIYTPSVNSVHGRILRNTWMWLVVV